MTDAEVRVSRTFRRGRRRKLWAVASACAVLAAAVTGVVLLLRPPPRLHVFGEHGNFGNVPAAAGETVYLDTGLGGEGRLYMERVTPIVERNTSKASVKVVACMRRPGTVALGEGTRADLDAACSATRRFTAGSYRVQPNTGTTELLVAVHPTQPGEVRMAGFAVQYHRGNRRGHEQSGIDLQVVTRP